MNPLAWPAVVIAGLKTDIGKEIAKGLLIGLCVLLLAFGVYRVVSAVAERDVLRTDLAASQGQVAMGHIAATVTDKVVTQAATAKQAIAVTEAVQATKTDDALAAHKDWAETPIPIDVQASMND